MPNSTGTNRTLSYAACCSMPILRTPKRKLLRTCGLHEHRPQRQLEKDKAELRQLQQKRFAQQEQERQAEIQGQRFEARRQQLEADEAQRRRERREVKERAASVPRWLRVYHSHTPPLTGAIRWKRTSPQTVLSSLKFILPMSFPSISAVN